jgi:hypothetical protein
MARIIKKTEELWKDGKSGISVENTRLARIKSETTS